jgi:hypothetical protein
MKKFKIAVLPLARTDIREARKWYNNQQRGLGKRLNADMNITLRKIARNPTSFAVRYNQVRFANFDSFPYAAHFYIDPTATTVYILGFIHTSRNPDTTKDR